MMNLLSIIPGVEDYILYAAIGALALVVLIIVIVACSKKKKANKAKKVIETPVITSKQEVKAEEVKAEEVKAEEVKAEEVKVEETKAKDDEDLKAIKEDLAEEKTTTIEVEKKPAAKKATSKKETKVEENKAEEDKTENKRVVAGKYEVFPVDEFFVYRLKASNGEILVTSEIYKSLKGAISAIDTVKKNAEDGEIQIDKDKHGLFQFKLFAANKRLLVVSATYPTQAGCESAANSFKKFALISPVVELEEDPEHLMEEINIEKDDDKKGGKIVVSGGDYYDFVLKASNGAIICSSYDYKTKAACLAAIDNLKQAVNEGTFFVVKDKKGMHQFKLYTTTGRCIVYGQAYQAKATAIGAANSVASFINQASVVEE